MLRVRWGWKIAACWQQACGLILYCGVCSHQQNLATILEAARAGKLYLLGVLYDFFFALWKRSHAGEHAAYWY